MNVRILPDIDTGSPTWRAVARWMEGQIETARKNIEAPGLGMDETQALRGEIRLARRLLALNQPGPSIPPQDGDYHAGR